MTKYKIQNRRSLREEMKAVVRGERPAPADAAKPSFNSARARALSAHGIIARGVVSICALVLCASAMAELPEPFARDTESTELDGQEVKVDFYRPSAGPPIGIAIVAHGFGRSRARHVGLGEALAAAGITAVIPDLPHTLDHWGNGNAVVELTRKLETGTLGLPPIDRSRLVLIGTSAGGLSTVLAAAKLPGLAGWIGLDPVDRTGTGIHAAAEVDAPAVVLLGKASGCNLYRSGRSIARAVPGLLRTMVLDGASHCDFEGPTNNFCRAICGGSSAAMQALAREETVRAAVEMLQGPFGRRTSNPLESAN